MTMPIIAAASALAELAPSVIKWIDPSFNTKNKYLDVANRVVDIAKKVSGVEDTDSLINALKKDPKLILQFQENVAELEKDLLETEIADRDSARKRDIAMMQMGHSNRRADAMVISAAFGLVCCLFSLGFFKSQLPGEAVGIISTIAGIFGACLKDAYAFEFGSSREGKARELSNIIKKPII